MSSLATYVRRETAISAVINAAISAGFFLALFGLGGDVPVWGVGNYAFDFLPQSFAVAFFASIVPTLLARKALRSGKLGRVTASAPATGTLLVQAIAWAVAAMLLAAGLWAGGLWLSGISAIDSLAAFLMKVFHGAALGALVTRYRLRTMIG